MKRLSLFFVLLLILGFAGQAGATYFGNINQVPLGGAYMQQTPIVLGVPFTSWIDNIWLPTAGTAVSYTLPTDGAGASAKEIIMSCTNPVWVRYAGTAPAVPTSTSITDGSGSEYQPVMRMPVSSYTAISIMPTVSGTVCSIACYK